MSFWRAGPEGVTIMVKVQPRARRAGLQGLAETTTGPRLKIAVTQPPEDGKANRAACAVLAAALDCPASAVSVLIGATQREKVLAVSGDAAGLEAKLSAL